MLARTRSCGTSNNMGAGHQHDHGGRNLGIAFLLNLGFAIFELAGGLWTNSVAILSDALHDAGDSLSLAIAWLMQRMSRRSRDERFTYGYRRFSVLGALITSVVLVIGLGFIITHAVDRFNDPQEVHGLGMLVIAVVGITVNGYAAWRLKSGTSLNESVASWHLLEDVLGWAAVLVGALIIWQWHIYWIDPALSIGISLFILWNVVKNLRRVGHVFLQRIPEGFSVPEFVDRLKELNKVLDVHHIHVWTLDGEHHVLTTHLLMHESTNREEIVETKEQIRRMIPEDFEHVTIDVEIRGECCISRNARSPVTSTSSPKLRD